ncbi:SNF2-related protein [Horticoccus sp. 23ND18S-11]|uniref:SNF2-related protein n=1 Tax=Horticoccus sp. 23ND18S-11 TaxID=3391832 RepID=UPI0039C9216C
MPPRARPPIVRSVQTPEALGALRTWLGNLPTSVRERGEAYYANKQVEKVWAGADHYVEAKIGGEEPFGVTLFLTLGKWSSRCSCPRRENCSHAYAAGKAWFDEVDTKAATGNTRPENGDASADAMAVAIAPAPRPTFAAPPAKAAFREQWTPVLAKKLGRALTVAEGNQLENLAGLFAEFVQAHGTLYPGTLLRHGFEHTPPRGAPLYAPALAGWWDHATAPTDPWALWQYIAYDHELAGRPIPEVFRPLTNTSSLRHTIEERGVQNDLAAWQRALAATDDSTAVVRSHSATAEVAGLRARIRPEGGILIETRAGPGKPWRSPPQKWFAALASARPIDFNHLTPPEAALGVALAAECAAGLQGPTVKQPLAAEAAANLFRTRDAREAIVMHDGRPLVIEPNPLALEASISTTARDRLDLRLVTPDGRSAARATLVTLRPSPLYYFENRVWNGPPPTPATPLPTAALGDTRIMTRLRAVGLRLPAALESNVRRIPLRPRLKCWLTPAPDDVDTMEFHAQLFARADDFPIEQHWINTGWQWTPRGAPALRRPDDPLLEFDLAAAQDASSRLTEFGLTWSDRDTDWARPVGEEFPEEFIAWHATLPPGLKVDASPGLANLLGPPLQAHVEFSAAPAEAAGRDWFNLTVKLRVSDTTLTPDEIALLTKARGKWVSLPRHGWRRLELVGDPAGGSADDALDRLGLDTADVLTDGRPHTHRVHALQLASEADLLETRDAKLAATLREHSRTLATQPTPPLPEGLRATLRPYQQEGFHFLAHLSALGLGGVLADDMGLGKTVQTLAWLLHLAENREEGSGPLRVLVVCPKSVTHGWMVETERFAPSLHAVAYNPSLGDPNAQTSPDNARLLIANYTQLRINAAWFKQQPWDAVVLDEGQFIKNPGSQVASVARALLSKHRLVLTGTPIENRLTDLWSLFAFAQPGLLGTQSSFRRHYTDTNPAAHTRLHRRVRHFLLRRTKAQAAPELPSRTEDDLVVELEGEQRHLYDAELKRARAQLLGVDTHHQLNAVRFNVLSSLLRLRQICCHPALVDPAHRDLPSAKLDALLERVEELRDEGHQVLVFSQFVEMLEIIRMRLAAADIGHLMLTGQTENRAELVDEFQRDRTKTVFLLSLKAAGFGLNLTAASYVILYDPWWNPAAEAQAIDRTHRIGQTQPVVAYRLLAEGTVEEKIRALQKEKAALAAAVVQEESLASILDLDSLRQILA